MDCGRYRRERGLFTLTVGCKGLIGRRPELVARELTTRLSECEYRRPSALALDDLDALCGKPEGEQGWAEEVHLDR